uniref:Uncharacterized protein n=1 Tax=Mus spicilegus TaxID=10103 RepID=A0A8C6GAI0_MUSSI
MEQSLRAEGLTPRDLIIKYTLISDADKPEPLALCLSLGRSLFSCMLDPKTLHVMLYKTSSGQYGVSLSRSQFLPCKHTPKEQMSPSHMRATGLYPNNCLNTTPDQKYILLTTEEREWNKCNWTHTL